jgi:DNA-binding NarL/FixJ family response regulator
MGDAEPAEGGAVTVLVVDDQQAFRNAMRALIDAAEGFTLVGDASSGEEALDLVDELSPRMVIMDKRMPGMGGIEASRAITTRHPTVVVLIASIEEPDAEMLASSGAAAFVSKQAMSTGLLRQVWRDHRI